MYSFMQILKTVQCTTNKSILVTIIHIDGSAYLKEGTSMLIEENGHCVGMISPGCLEDDLLLRCKEIFQTLIPLTVEYDLRSTDDYSWGQGMGCNGVMRVLLEPVTDELKNYLLFLKTSLENGLSVLHQKEFSKDYYLTGYTFSISHTEHEFQFHPTSDGYLYTYYYTPPPILHIFGAGEDAKSLVSLASKIGFVIKLYDWRPGLCNKARFSLVHQFHVNSTQHIINSLTITKNDFFVIMSHSFLKDQEMLTYLLQHDVRYIGVLGSKDRIHRLLAGKEPPQNMFAPIGLAIGAQGPEEIAVSIMAEIIQEYRK